MANTIALTRYERGSRMFQGAFSDMWLITASITDTDAIAQSKIAFIKDFVRRKIDVKRNGSSSKIDLSSMSTEELKKLAGV